MKASIVLLIIVITGLCTSCEGCSRSGRNRQMQHRNATLPTGERYSRYHGGEFKVKMEKKNGVYEIPVKINGSGMNFIFDTGASDITISAVEAMFLIRQGTLSEEDILGIQQYQIADGSISEGTLINLKTVQIGNKTIYNVKASVVDNISAPLLLGQSALASFGKVSIDYKRGEIVFQ